MEKQSNSKQSIKFITKNKLNTSKAVGIACPYGYSHKFAGQETIKYYFISEKIKQNKGYPVSNDSLPKLLF